MTDFEPFPAGRRPARAPPFEDLLIGALASLEADGEAGLARFLAAHPAVAAQLCRRVERLRDIGLAGDDDSPWRAVRAAADPATIRTASPTNRGGTCSGILEAIMNRGLANIRGTEAHMQPR